MSEDKEAVRARRVAALAARVGVRSGDADLDACVTQATALITQHAGDRAASVPEQIMDLAITSVGSELWAQRNAVGGIVAAFADMGTSVRLARDPLIAARAILAPWLTTAGVGLA